MDDEPFEPDFDRGTDAVISTDRIVVTTYSDAAASVLRRAEAEARETDGVITCQLVLLSIIGDPTCAGARVLDECGFSADRLRAVISFVSGMADTQHDAEPEIVQLPQPHVVVSPRLERVLTAAGEEAGSRHATQIDTLHLLGALLRERQGMVAFALERPGVGLEPVGAAISHALRTGMTDPS
jgi:ATP-dependent Clp protease ATP-binding subunit ClpA